jgi:hypothetical protein
MNLQEIIIKSGREPKSLHKSDLESGDITLTQFRDTDSIDPHLEELCGQLVGLTSPGQVRAVLSLYLPQFDWGGQEV